MAATKVAKPVTSEPSRARLELFLGDDIRLERDGKITAVGLYTDRVIVGLMGAGQPEPTEVAPLALGTKAFVVSINGLQGPHSVSMGYFDPQLSVLSARGPTQQIDFPSPDLTANLVGRFDPLLVGSFGMKKVFVWIDDHKFELPFEVRRGWAPRESKPQPKVVQGARKQPKGKPTTVAASKRLAGISR